MSQLNNSEDRQAYICGDFSNKKKKKREDKAPEVWARMCTKGSETESVMKVL